MVSGQHHSILCWIVADAPESICSPCAMQASQAQAVQPYTLTMHMLCFPAAL